MRIVCSGKVNYKQDWSYVRPLNFLTLVRVLGSADEVGFLFRPTPVRVDGEDRVFTHMAGWATRIAYGLLIVSGNRPTRSETNKSYTAELLNIDNA